MVKAIRRREGVKIAIIEDEVILAMALTLMLEDWGHQVVGTADTEIGAMVLVKDERPDLVVMDIRLGRRDNGLRAARLIRANSDVPFVFCTAYADSPPIKAQVAAIGNTHLIGKPVDEDQFEWLLRTIDDRRQKVGGAPVFPSRTLQPASNDL
jgi:two-component system, response regulator PdtaR